MSQHFADSEFNLYRLGSIYCVQELGEPFLPSSSVALGFSLMNIFVNTFYKLSAHKLLC